MADAELQKVVIKYLQSGCNDQGGYRYRLCRDEQDLILQKEFLLQDDQSVPAQSPSWAQDQGPPAASNFCISKC